MGLLLMFGFLAVFYGTEWLTTLVRRARVDRLRSEAAYPITGNDPMGRIVV